MKEFTSLNDCHFSGSDETVIALGFFDGIHLAHQQVIRECISRARQRNGTSAVFTFQNHPTSVLSPDKAVRLLTPYPLKKMLMESLGVDVLIAVPFDNNIGSIPPARFIEEILAGVFKAKEVVVGYNFHFGLNRTGTVELFSKQIPRLFDRVTVISQQQHDHHTISSTYIRNKILHGDFDSAQKLLTRPFQLYGTVVRGQGRGRTIGFPTSNLETGEQLLPQKGVYSVSVRIANLSASPIPGIMNIGTIPTFTNQQHQTVEVHLLDFDEDLYGKNLIVDIRQFIRKEKKFSSAEELIKQIHEDISLVCRV